MNDKLKELEEHSAQIFELGCMERPVYLKEDVDAVIAGLKQKLEEQESVLAELKADYKEACGRLQTANLIKDEQFAATRHSKRKRCLAMAKWCESEAYIHEHGSDYDEDLVAWFGKWYMRWLELAEKFKDKETK